jgi:ornithine--oxo-acid transaminase
VALEALTVIEDERLVERSRELGAHLLSRLRSLSSPLIARSAARSLVGVELDPRFPRAPSPSAWPGAACSQRTRTKP